MLPAAAWPVTLFAADGATPLTDSDADGALDTGPLAPGATFDLVARVRVAPGAATGAYDHASLLLRSKPNPTKSLTADLAMGIPISFAQAYRDAPDYAMSLALNQPAGQAERKAGPDFHWGYDLAVAETSGGNFAYAWYPGRCLDQNCNRSTDEIEYTLLDRYGAVVRPLGKLTDNSGATYDTYDYNTSLAMAPNGQIAVTWVRQFDDRNANPSGWQDNVYFALLNAAGAPIPAWPGRAYC